MTNANDAPNSTAPTRLQVGCAMWAHRSWPGRHLPTETKDTGQLAAYATWCNAVEGNTTFYAVPPAATIERWREETPATFRFCFKLPRTITHERRLRNAEAELADFLARIDALTSRLGPIQIQLPSSFGPDDLGALTNFLDELPMHHEWGVELRNAAFFAGGDHERIVDDVLRARGINRVILDSRALFQAHPVTPEEVEAWEQKPRLAVRPVATGRCPVVRLIGQSDLDASVESWRRWISVLARWALDGLEPHVFTHTPDNVDAPPLARRFFDLVTAEIEREGGTVVPLPEPMRGTEQLGFW